MFKTKQELKYLTSIYHTGEESEEMQFKNLKSLYYLKRK